ncbi:helix-turn-helix transcriptional regulator [Nonlabens marinus]|uniref:HTH luxR-type domain-containing protein n=1 Tax=Nonlabens marinus S1-08 TaxID=1454201 RepID=W8VRP8_9FLAO|nr:helix-turn-helix transcriptional regulator [Nonlabens marinus]BAO56409.1 hypothetical protein NMS_2400 [Nonlabens marinus S1-08]
MNTALEAHKKVLRNREGEPDESLEEFIERFQEITKGPMYSNSLCYALNLSELKYVHVGVNCHQFTGKQVKDFKQSGVDILPKIMIEEDFKALSLHVFPQMQECYQGLGIQERKEAIFEIYYKLKHSGTGKITSVVEYSSYARYNEKGEPTVSTGIVYASPLAIDGVRGIVRCAKSQVQETIFDQTYLHRLETLTDTENKITSLFSKGHSRQEIADTLNISIHTVKTHFRNIYKKLEINKESELMNYLNSK